MEFHSKDNNTNLEISTEEKEIHLKNYERGFQDGKISAGEKCLENGFRDGVKHGIEVGYYLGYINFIKKFFEKNCKEEDKENHDKIISKIKSLTEKNVGEDSDLDEIKKCYKLLISSLKTLSKKINA